MTSSHRETLALNQTARKQSTSGPPVQDYVTVAVLPPRMPIDIVPGNGAGTAGVTDWDENVNWTHTQLVPDVTATPESRKKSFMRKAGITTRRNRRNPDLPPFRMRRVTYEVWRKHYAKDKDGNYHGTHAPAEDCLLKPEDVQKWSAESPETMGDTWTRGRRALPGYGEVQDQGEEALPEYVDLSSEETEGAEQQRADFRERVVSNSSSVPQAAASQEPKQPPPSGRTIDGKTSQQVIEEAKAREAAKKKKSGGGWMNSLKRGGETANTVR